LESRLSIGELLGRIRGSYLATLGRRLEELVAAGTGRVVPEPAVCSENGEVARARSLGLPTRMDFCVLREGEMAEVVCVEAEELFDFEPAAFVWGERLEVELRPFTWDFCELRFRAPVRGNLMSLVAWFRRWFDEDDERGVTNPFPGGVVHSMSDPMQDGEDWRLAIDLGSARLKAFEELIDAVAATGAARVRIG
jgi:hypothetical protein